jgi:hypothetical protein
MKIIGTLVFIIGLGMTLFTAISYFTKEKIVELGAVEITRNNPHYLAWSPFVGMGIMVLGAFLIIQGRKKNDKL